MASKDETEPRSAEVIDFAMAHRRRRMGLHVLPSRDYQSRSDSPEVRALRLRLAELTGEHHA